MIVADTNVLLYQFTSDEFGGAVAALLAQDPDWHAPLLWRSEFPNGLATMMRANVVQLKQAAAYFHEAAEFMKGREHEAAGTRLLERAAKSGCTASDWEYIELGMRLSAPLYTADKKLIKAFPKICRTLFA